MNHETSCSGRKCRHVKRNSKRMAYTIKVTFLYGHPQDPLTFEQYYAETHLPLATEMKGVTRLEVMRFGLGPDGAQPAY
jgi:hypothetical protein